MKKYPIPKYGYRYTAEQFKIECELGALIDYDGFGHFATETHMWGEPIKPSEVRKPTFDFKGFKWVLWFNR